MSVERNPLHLCLLLLAFLALSDCIFAVAGTKEKSSNAAKKKKDIRDYNDADMERLFMEWEEAEDEHDPDDLLEHERPAPAIDLSQIDPNNPESALKLTKKGKTLMMFVSVSGSPSQEETETITSLWQSNLFNANYQLQRYPVSSDRVIFMLKDGSTAWEIKDFLIQQDRCQEVTIEGQVFAGKGSGAEVDPKGKIVGLDDEKSPKKKQQQQGKKAKTSDKKADTGKPKKPKSKKKKKEKAVKAKKQSTKDDRGKPSADHTSQPSGKESKRSSKQKTSEGKKQPEDVTVEELEDSENLSENTFFMESEDTGVDPSERFKKTKERLGSLKSAQPLVMPSEYGDEEADLPTKEANLPTKEADLPTKEQKDEL